MITLLNFLLKHKVVISVRKQIKKDSQFVASMFLHKKGTKFDEVIDTEHLKEINHTLLLSSSKYGSGKLFEFEPVGKKPVWEKYIKKFDSEIDLNSSLNNSVVITLYVGGRLVSLTFGYGNSKLNSKTLVSDFGKKSSIKLVNLDEIREVSDVTISETTFQNQKRNIGNKNSKSIFSNDPSSFLKGVSGYANVDWNYPFTNGAFFSSVGSSLKIKVNIEIEKNLKNLIIYILKKYDEDLSNELSYFNKITPIMDETLVNNLWNVLYKGLSDDNLSNFSIAYPDFSNKDYILENIPDRNYNLKSNVPGVISFKFIDVIKSNKLDIEWISHKITTSYFFVTDSYNQVHKASLKRSLISELFYNGCYYVLLFGIWYSINLDFLKDLNREIKSIEESNENYPNHNSTEEKQYFSKLEDTFGWANIDLKTYSPKDGSMDKVEVADFVSSNHEFTHVKYGHASSSKLSHLFLQGNNSGELMSKYGEQGFVDKVNGLLKKQGFPSTYLGEQGRKIRFLIMKENNKRNDIPLFSKISLRTAKRNLESLGFSVSYVLVNK